VSPLGRPIVGGAQEVPMRFRVTVRQAISLAAVVTLASAGAAAQSTAAGQKPAASTQKPSGSAQKPNVKGVRGVPIVSVEGKDNFDAYCAVCHGTDGKGNGPAAPAMKATVPDLTTIAKRNGGKFDAVRVQRLIQGVDRTNTPAHGVEDMPIWGDVFKSDDKGTMTLRVTNLVSYVQSLQQK
jgi:mono/diheme cytochrome c family protein